MSELLIPLLLAIAANCAAEWLLARELALPWQRLSRPAHMLRLLRWLSIMAGHAAVALLHPSAIVQVNLALFSVTAATDLESRRIPPDAFTYCAVALACALDWASGGAFGLRDVIVAQALCFAAMVLAVMFFNAADAGDVKVLMHFGAACGSLTVVGAGIVVETALRVLVLLVALGLRGRPALRLRLPHAPFAWAGLVLALCVR